MGPVKMDSLDTVTLRKARQSGALPGAIRKKGNDYFEPFSNLLVRKGGKKRTVHTSRSYVVGLEKLTPTFGNKVSDKR